MRGTLWPDPRLAAATPYHLGEGMIETFMCLSLSLSEKASCAAKNGVIDGVEREEAIWLAGLNREKTF